MISSDHNKQNRHQRRMLELLKAPKVIRFEEMKTILHNSGYRLAHSKGSHFKFKKPHTLPIIIAVHNNKVAKIYVKKTVKLLLFYI